MKLIVNLSNNLGGGGLQVALSFLSECRHFGENEYHVFMSPNVAGQIDRSSFGQNFIFYDIPPVSFWKLARVLAPLEKQIRPDAVFTVFGPSYWRPKALHIMGFAIGHYIYPESIFLKNLSWGKKIRLILKKTIQCSHIKHNADIYITETEDATSRFKKLLKKTTVYTVSNTCGTQYFHPVKYPPLLPEKADEEIRLLTVSSYYPHKNLEIIPKVIDILTGKNIQNVRFVLTLHPDDYRRIIPYNYREHVYNTGPVITIKCPSLYNECDAMFLPTLLETFSANYPEAMAMKRPILTSNLGFAHSICGDAALYFNPSDPSDIAEKIIHLITNKTLYEDLVKKGMQRLSFFPSPLQKTEAYLSIIKESISNLKTK